MRRWCWIIVMAIALGGVMACGSAADETPRARWAARTFSNYQMTLVDLRCRMQVTVEGVRVVRTVPHTCPQPSRSIDELFDLIARDGSVGIACAYSGCACHDVYHIDARHHPALGYPLHITVRLTPTPNWWHPDAWRRALTQRTTAICNYVEGTKQIVVESLTPR